MLPNTTASETGQRSDRLSTSEINLACAQRSTLERMQAQLAEANNAQLQVAADLVAEAILYLGIAIAGLKSAQGIKMVGHRSTPVDRGARPGRSPWSGVGFMRTL